MEHVSVNFGGVAALTDVSLEVGPRRILGVIGPNGAGKTTLFNVACGFVNPKQGRLEWRGASLERHRPHDLAKLGIGRTLQGLGLFDRLTVVENVMVAANHRFRPGFLGALLALPSSDRRERELRSLAMSMLVQLRLEDHAGRLPADLPYQLRKRVAIARALVAEPDLLLLDEPAGGLSHDEIVELGELIRDLGKTCSVMLVEHHMDLVLNVCDDIVVLDFGRVIARGTPSEVSKDPAVTAAYLGTEVTAPGAATVGSEA